MDSIIRKSTACNQLYEAMSAFQGEVENAEKTKTARVRTKAKEGRPSYTYTFQYADIADVLTTTRPTLARHGLTAMQPTVIENGQLRIVTHIGHKSGQWMEADYPVCRVGDIPHQEMGAALTYAKRYALCAILGVASESDVGGSDNDESGADIDVGAGDPPREPPRETSTPPKSSSLPEPERGQPASPPRSNRVPRENPAFTEAKGKLAGAPVLANLEEVWSTIKRVGGFTGKDATLLESAYYVRKRELLETAKSAKSIETADLNDEEWLNWVSGVIDDCATIDALSEIWATRVEPTLEGRNPNIRQDAHATYQRREREIADGV